MPGQNTIHPILDPPMGAGELREVHGDWLVVGLVQTVIASTRNSCVIVQERVDTETGERLFLMELRLDAGRVSATLVLPVGLLFRKGIVLQIDNGRHTRALPFSSAIPLGRFVEMVIDAPRILRMKAGKVLYIHAAAADNGRPITFDLSLNGFAAAFAHAESIGN